MDTLLVDLIIAVVVAAVFLIATIDLSFRDERKKG